MTKTDIGELPPDVLSFGILLVKELESVYKTTFKRTTYTSGNEVVWIGGSGAITISSGKIASLLFNDVGPIERSFILTHRGYITDPDSITRCLEIANSLMILEPTTLGKVMLLSA